MLPSYSHKRGDTFSLAGPGTLPAGTWTAVSQLRDASTDRLIDNLDVTLSPFVSGAYTHQLALAKDAAATALWPIATLLLDVQFVDAGGTVRSTQTVQVNVTRDITHA